MVGGAKGVIRTMLCNGEFRSEVIPVDIAINGLISVAWKIGTTVVKWVEEIKTKYLKMHEVKRK